jgi:hypothetical protein
MIEIDPFRLIQYRRSFWRIAELDLAGAGESFVGLTNIRGLSASRTELSSSIIDI